MTPKPVYNNHIEHYQKDASTYNFFEFDAFMQQEWRRRYETIFHLLKIKDNARILDIGAGGGIAWHFVKGKAPSYLPLDIAITNLREIRKKDPERIDPVSGDVYHLPFRKNTFDIILMTEVLEHLDNPEKALQSIHGILKEDGQFVLSVPYKEKLVYHLCIHCNKPTPANAHLHSFDEQILKELLKTAALNPVKGIKCINKPFNRLYGNRLLKSLPYPIWKIIDAAMNKLIKKPVSIVLKCKKELS